jgi:hypothetical protein
MNMKKLIPLTLLATLASTGSAFALPVLNANAPGAETVTVFPDHADPNLYYTAPTVFTVSKNEAGVPNFSYVEYLTGGYRRAFVQTTLRPNFTYSEMQKTKQQILAMNPAARFTALPFERARVAFADSLKDMMVQTDCLHPAGTVGDEQTCTFHLRNQGVKTLRPLLKKGHLAITTQFVYTINGVRQNADGTYTNQLNEYQVAGRIGDSDIAAHPELFQDYKGNTINGLMPNLQFFLDKEADLPYPGVNESGAGTAFEAGAIEANASFVPMQYRLAEDHAGVPLLDYEKQEDGGVLAFILRPDYERAQIQGVPVKVEAEVSRGNLSPRLFSEDRCTVRKNLNVYCRLRLTKLGAKVFSQTLKTPIGLLVHITYTVAGQAEGDPETAYGIAGKVGHPYFKDHPLNWE